MLIKYYNNAKTRLELKITHTHTLLCILKMLFFKHFALPFE